jgi:hypothetical protein
MNSGKIRNGFGKDRPLPTSISERSQRYLLEGEENDVTSCSGCQDVR